MNISRICPQITKLDRSTDPSRAFAALSARPWPFWLDSALPDDERARWSFVGCDPFLTFTVRDGRCVIRLGRRSATVAANPFELLRSLLAQYQIERFDTDIPLVGGAVGYLGYEMARHLEKLPDPPPDDVHLPDAMFGFYDVILAFDHVSNSAWLVSTGLPETDEPARCTRAGVRADQLRSLLAASDEPDHHSVDLTSGTCSADMSPDEYRDAVQAIRQSIIAGDVYEVNLSQRFTLRTDLTPIQLHHRLRRINPAPFAACLDYGDFGIVSSSPERFLCKRRARLESRPIKGTRPRGETPDNDARLARELLTSEKDRAENVMIVDLVRNDLGRVCSYGSVTVAGLAELETFPSVHHLTSTITGRLRDDCDAVDALTAAFPGGSITGAPKVSAMESISRHETCRRGVYTGSIGYLGFDGDFDFNIAIRTITLRDGRAAVHTGGAIVFDSDPQQEYEETLVKANSMLRAVQRSGQQVT
ncbi:aminodeoxychorismate synthase component I [candidate division GN15 bacterium]|nr:aminodeoxychorismate synthase component I [candidate division GN15 bacterium]